MNAPSLPVLYSFRRCPYAIRARLAIKISDIKVELREVHLKDKPAQMLQASPKGTVPVLTFNGDISDADSADAPGKQNVIDESLEIMLWALKQSDPLSWLAESSLSQSLALIETNDRCFKKWLDRYKYAIRLPEHEQHYYFERGLSYLSELDSLLMRNQYLLDNTPRLADYALLPFVRQFAMVDKLKFDNCPLQHLKQWLSELLDTKLFKQAMLKYPKWQTDKPGVEF